MHKKDQKHNQIRRHASKRHAKIYETLRNTKTLCNDWKRNINSKNMLQKDFTQQNTKHTWYQTHTIKTEMYKYKNGPHLKNMQPNNKCFKNMVRIQRHKAKENKTKQLEICYTSVSLSSRPIDVNWWNANFSWGHMSSCWRFVFVYAFNSKALRSIILKSIF